MRSICKSAAEAAFVLAILTLPAISIAEAPKPEAHQLPACGPARAVEKMLRSLGEHPAWRGMAESVHTTLWLSRAGTWTITTRLRGVACIQLNGKSLSGWWMRKGESF